jgi:hypothetical protein
LLLLVVIQEIKRIKTARKGESFDYIKKVIKKRFRYRTI